MDFGEDTPQIQMSRIPVGKGLGALAVIVIVIGAMLVELPSLRGPVLLGAGGGCVLAAILIAWHARQRQGRSDEASLGPHR